MKKLHSNIYTDNYYDQDNKINVLKDIKDKYKFLVSSINSDEYTIKSIKSESYQRWLNDSSKDGIPTEEDLTRSITGDYSDLFKASDYETLYLWYDKETKDNYLANSLFEIERELDNSLWYVAQNDIVDNRDLSMLDFYAKKLLKIKSIINSHLDKDYYKAYELELNEVLKMYDFDEDLKRPTDKETKERYLKIKNHITNLDNKEDDQKNRRQRKSHKYIVGMLVAKGELNKYWNNTKSDFKQNCNRSTVEKDLNIIGKDKVIYDTIKNTPNNHSTGKKNVFNDFKTMSLIIDDCKESEVKVDSYFLQKFNELKENNI